MDENRRNFSRVKFKSKAFLNYRDSQEEVNLIDISLKGALISPISNLAIQKGEACVFEFHLSESEIIMNINSLVVYKRNSHLGLMFDNIDLDSMIHLRRLVELNIGDPDQIQKELFFLVSPYK
jgi:hypothetical protein